VFRKAGIGHWGGRLNEGETPDSTRQTREMIDRNRATGRTHNSRSIRVKDDAAAPARPVTFMWATPGINELLSPEPAPHRIAAGGDFPTRNLFATRVPNVP